MAYLGNTPTTQSFISGTDYFSGNGSTTAFTLSRTVASVNDIEAVVNNVVQRPNDAYTISGTTITFTSAPSSGTDNIYVRYLSTTTQSITPSQGTVSPSSLTTGGPYWDSSGNLGVGTTSPSSLLHLSSTLPILKFTDTDDSATTRIYQDNADFVIEVDGTDTKASSSLKFQVDNTVRMTIDSAGRVTMPSQPMMYASSSGGTYSGGANPLTLASNLLNIGNNYNTGNGRFTAPVAGRYQAIFTGLKQGSGGADYAIRKNGTTIITAYATGDVATFATHLVLELAASDYITFSAGANWYTDYTSYSVQLVS